MDEKRRQDWGFTRRDRRRRGCMNHVRGEKPSTWVMHRNFLLHTAVTTSNRSRYTRVSQTWTVERDHEITGRFLRRRVRCHLLHGHLRAARRRRREWSLDGSVPALRNVCSDKASCLFPCAQGRAQDRNVNTNTVSLADGYNISSGWSSRPTFHPG